MFIVVPPVRLEPGNRGGRQTRRVGAEQRGQGFLEIAGGNAFEVEPRQQFLDGFGLAQIRRQERRGKPHFLSLLPSIPHARHFDCDRADAGHDFTLGQVAMSDNPRMSLLRRFVGKLGQQSAQLSLKRLLNQLARA